MRFRSFAVVAGAGVALLATFLLLVVGTTGDPQKRLSPGAIAASDSVNEFVSNDERSKRPEFVADELLVRFKTDATAADKKALRSKYEMKRKEKLPVADLERLTLPQDSDVKETAEKLSDESIVAYAEPNFYRTLAATPNDTEYSKLWGLHNSGQTVNNVTGTADADIDAPEAWDVFTGSSTVKVAVIDTGVDYNHADLSGNIWTNTAETAGNGIDDDANGYVDDVRGWDFVGDWAPFDPQDNDPMDVHSHGTHVAGTIGAAGNNGQGISGVAWQSKIMPVKIFDSYGSTTASAVVNGLAYAGRNGAQVANGSFGGPQFSQSELDSIAAYPNTLYVFAAGNDAANNDSVGSYPCNYDSPNTLCVAATDQNDGLASFSNYGATKVDLGAPGVNIYSSKPGGGYKFLNGTSMASPHVAGAATLLRAYDTTANVALVREAIVNGVNPVPSLAGKTVTGGRLNLVNSLNILRPANGTARVQTGGGRLTYSAGNGSTNNLTISLSGSTYTVNDSGTALTAGTGCTQVNANRATCSSTGVSSITARTQDLNDTISITAATASTVSSGSGDDSITTAGGNDTLDGELGNDVFNGGSGVDTVDYSSRSAAVTATINGTANDGISGETDNVTTSIENVIGGSAGDTLTGSSSANTLTGNGGNDTLNGGSGNDVLLPGLGTDVLNGNGGTDTGSYADRSSAVTVTNEGTANDGAAGENDNVKTDVENITGGGGNDTLTGNSSANTFNGGGGDDTIRPSTGVDVIYGNAGVDTVDYSERTSAVTITINDTGNDGVSFENDNVRTDVENVKTGTANDTITGSSADNTFDGSTGNDTYNGGAGSDTATYASRTAAVTATIDGTANDGVSGETDNVKTDMENITGGSGNDTLTGSSSVNKLIGGLGNETLNGGDGDDTLDPGKGTDVINGGNGSDTVDYSSRNNYDDYINGLETGITVTLDGVANDGRQSPAEGDNAKADVENVIGTYGSDTLTGNSSANLLDGGQGEDTLTGNDGNDRLVGGPTTSEWDIGYGAYNYLSGGNGDDQLEGGGFPTYFDAEPGADTYVANGGGQSRLSYETRNTPLTIKFDGIANDGAAGEGDNLLGYFTNVAAGQSDDEVVVGGGTAGVEGLQGNDTITGNNGWVVLSGDEGDDRMIVGPNVTQQSGFSAYYGGSGSDTIDYSARTSAVNVSLDGDMNDGAPGEGHYVAGDVENAVGTDFDDTLTGGYAANKIEAGLGCDILTGENGNDELIGGPANEYDSFCGNEITGGSGDDRMVGTASEEYFYPEAGADTYESGGGTDTLDFSARTLDQNITLDNVADDGDPGEGDNIKGNWYRTYLGSGNDLFIGSNGLDAVEAGAGNDVIEGRGGSNYLDGNEGDDLIHTGDGSMLGSQSAYYGSAGTDTVSYSQRTAPVTISIDGNDHDGEAGENGWIANDVENLEGGLANDSITGNSVANVLDGNGGLDTIVGGNGDDTIEAQDGNDDAIDCGGGLDSLFADLLPYDVGSGCETVSRS